MRQQQLEHRVGRLVVVFLHAHDEDAASVFAPELHRASIVIPVAAIVVHEATLLLVAHDDDGAASSTNRRYSARTSP